MGNPLRPTAYSKVTIQHNNLNRKHIIQNQKLKCKNNTQLIYLNFTHCACKFEKRKQSFLIENYQQLPLTKSIDNLTHVRRKTNLSLVETIIELSIINNILQRSL